MKKKIILAIFLVVVIWITLISALIFAGCSYRSNRIRNNVHNLGIEAIAVADQFLDMEIEASEALRIINGLVLDNRNKFEAYGRHSEGYFYNLIHRGDLPRNKRELSLSTYVLIYMGDLSRNLLGERGQRPPSHEAIYKEVLEARNNLAELLNQPLREN